MCEFSRISVGRLLFVEDTVAVTRGVEPHRYRISNTDVCFVCTAKQLVDLLLRGVFRENRTASSEPTKLTKQKTPPMMSRREFRQ